MGSSKREDSSPILKKAGAALQLRSTYLRWCGFLESIHSLSPPLKEHSTAGEGLPFPSCNFLTCFTYDAPAPSTEAATKSQFCATVHVEYTQSGFATATATTTVEVRNSSRRSCDAFGQSAEQCVNGIIISTNTNSTLYTCFRSRLCTSATEA
jgi:hypothetical protein